MKRYETEINSESGWVVEADDGDLVYYEDVKKLEAESKRLREALEEIIYKTNTPFLRESMYHKIAKAALEGEE